MQFPNGIKGASADQQHLRKVHNDSGGGQEGPERYSALQGAGFCQVGVQKKRTCGKTGQQDDEQGGLQSESKAQDRKQFDIAAPDSVRKSETCKKQQRKDHEETDEGCSPIRNRKYCLAEQDTKQQQELKTIGNQLIEIIGDRYDEQQREHKGESKQLPQIRRVEIIKKARHKAGNDFRSEVHCIYFCCAVCTFPAVAYIRKKREKILGLQRMLAMDAVGTCGGEIFFDGDTCSEYSEEGSENGSEIKDG